MAKQAKVHDYDKPQEWSDESVDFVNSLLIRKQNLRLGNDKPGCAKSHPWFENFDWTAFESQKLVSPFAGIVFHIIHFYYRKSMKVKIANLIDPQLMVSLMMKKQLS
jgi:hypothetical protein